MTLSGIDCMMLQCALMSEMGLDIVGAMITHKLSKLPLSEQERLRTEFAFEGLSQSVDKDTSLLRAIRLSLKNEKAKQNGEPTRGRKP